MAPRKKAKYPQHMLPSSYGFHGLPLDILFEIFSLVHPLDLLHLSRTNKSLRAFLLNRSNVAIWRAAFATSSNNGGPPECPSYMSPPAWARLAFEKTCVICTVNLRDEPYVDSIWWEFGGRYCSGCLKKEISGSIPQKLKTLVRNCAWNTVFPRVPKVYGDRWYYLVAHQRELMDECTNTEDPTERLAIVARRTEKTRLVVEHSKRCREWAMEQIRQRRAQADLREQTKIAKAEEKRKERLQKVDSKLRQLGWSDEPWMCGGSLKMQIQYYPAVNQSKSFRELQPLVVAQLNADKRVAILSRRFEEFRLAQLDIQTPLQNMDLARSISPRMVDVALIPQVRALLEADGEVVPLRGELRETLQPLMPGLLQAWVTNALTQVGVHARQCLGLTDETSATDPLELAIAFAECPNKCGTAAPFSALSKHVCHNWLNAPQRCYFYSSSQDAYQVAAERSFGTCAFDPTSIPFSKNLEKLKDVVKAYGRDPETTTMEDMEAEQRLLCCETCADRAKGRRERGKADITRDPMNGFAAMLHSTRDHLGGRDQVVAWKLL